MIKVLPERSGKPAFFKNRVFRVIRKEFLAFTIVGFFQAINNAATSGSLTETTEFFGVGVPRII
jgi:hypothetical protein